MTRQPELGWTELRTAALVGTQRRALPAGDSFLLPSDIDAERRALHMAAVLGIGQRVGWSAQPSAATAHAREGEPVTPTRELLAPPKAVQMLELMVSGNAGPGALAPSLYRLWFDQCVHHESVLPHRLLVSVLEFGTANPSLQDAIVAVLGRRGRWLASQRARWSWAGSIDTTITVDTEIVDAAALLSMGSEQRLAAARRARSLDARRGRELIAEACEELDASSRSRLLAVLEVGLSVDDEDLLEAALDDRSKAVRTIGLQLLEQLPQSARATRLGDWLAPYVSVGTKRRKLQLDVAFPQPPEHLQLRDLPPTNRNAVIEELWFDALVGGTALEWWEATTGRPPADIVAAVGERADLLRAWMHAALAQHNQSWARALLKRTLEPALVGLAGSDQAAALFVQALDAETSDAHRLALLAEVPTPWPDDLARSALHWLQTAKHPGAALEGARHVLANGLSPAAASDLERWLVQAKLDKDQRLARHLRNLMQQLSFRSSIIEAFQ